MPAKSGKLILVAFGVSQPGSSGLEPIPCVSQDLQRIYATFASAAGSKFDHSRSVCVLDPTKAEAASVLEVSSATAAPDDTLVVYFSGHGQLVQSRLKLVFSDATKVRRGRATQTELGEWLSDSAHDTVLIFDCCYSGAATGVANRKDGFDPVRLSVLSSSWPFATSEFGDDGSRFTKALCSVIQKLSRRGSLLSLNEISRRIRDEHQIPCQVNVGEGAPDKVLPSDEDWGAYFPTSLARDFYYRASRSPHLAREMLWYAAGSAPIRRRIDIVEHYVQLASTLGEPSWLVRRAIGSLLSSCEDEEESWRRMVVQLLRSPNWMSKCIGLIGARKHIDDPELQRLALAVLREQERMDAVWLAHLYLSDAAVDAFEDVASTRLRTTTWGMIEIVQRWFLGPRRDERVLGLLGDEAVEVRRAVATHLLLSGVEGHAAGSAIDDELVASDLVRFLYGAPRRGSTASATSKWLLSTLYGYWRDHLAEGVGDWLDNHSESDGVRSLTLVSRVAPVEMRMSVFQYMHAHPEARARYAAALQWGLTDTHPWVRREALRALGCSDGNLSMVESLVCDMSVYPGALDLMLAAGRVPVSISAVQDALTVSERRAIEWAVAVEKDNEWR